MEERVKRSSLLAEIDRLRARCNDLHMQLLMFRKDGIRVMELHRISSSDNVPVHCAECSHEWPCDTYRIESGLGNLSKRTFT